MLTYFYKKIYACESYAFYKMWCKVFITHINLAAAA